MKIDFEVITKDFENALVRYKIACGKSFQFVIKQQARLVGEKVLKFTPPEKQSVGKANIASDIGKVFADLGATKWDDKSLDKMWRAGNFEGVKKALSNAPNKDDMPVFKYERIFKQPIRNIHKSAIGGKGRVPKNWQTRFAVGGKGELKKYVRKIQTRVGIARSGWLAGIIKLGGKAPSWVSRHGTAFGDFVDKSAGDNPFVELINKVRTFPKGSLPVKIVSRAIKAQTRAMENNVKRILSEKKL